MLQTPTTHFKHPPLISSAYTSSSPLHLFLHVLIMPVIMHCIYVIARGNSYMLNILISVVTHRKQELCRKKEGEGADMQMWAQKAAVERWIVSGCGGWDRKIGEGQTSRPPALIAFLQGGWQHHRVARSVR
jgi:hypothetical protein